MTVRTVAAARPFELFASAPSTEPRRTSGLSALPDRIVLVTMTVFVVAAACAIFRVMEWWVFVPALAVVLVLGWRFVPQALPQTLAYRTGSIAAVVLSAVWFLVQAPFASQYFAAVRDPGIYLLSGAVIARTGGSPIDISSAHSLVAAVPGLADALGAFGSSNGVDIRLQGSTGVPAMIAIGFWIAGAQGAILVNLIIGAVGLLAVYGLGRRFMGPYWALLPAGLLGVAMPYVYLSRTTYTEITATLVVVASATWGISAFASRRISDFAIAGAFAGAAALTRVDGALSFAGALLGLVLVILGVGRRLQDDGLRWRLLAFAGAGWLLLGLGILDLYYNEARYLNDLGASPKQLWLLAAGLTVILVALAATRLGTGRFEYTRATRLIAIGSSVALAGLVLFWLSRPAWLIYHDTTGTPYLNAISGLQAQDGLPIDPTRSYDEYSLAWFGWYFGWPFLILAAAGLCAWVYWALTRRNAGHVVILATTALVALLYIDSIKITPDQIWAFRRVLPVITTALVLSASLALRWLWHRGVWLRRLGILALIACVVGVGLPWGRIFFSVEGSGQANEITRICQAVDGAKVAAYVAPGAPANYALTVRAVCGIQTVVIADPTTFDWTALAAAAHGRVAVVAFDRELVPWTTVPTGPLTTTAVHMWTRHLLQSPRTTSLSVRSVYVGRLLTSGRVDAAVTRG